MLDTGLPKPFGPSELMGGFHQEFTKVATQSSCWFIVPVKRDHLTNIQTALQAPLACHALVLNATPEKRIEQRTVSTK